MKLLCVLILAVFATCEGISTRERIAQQAHARLVSNGPARRAFSARLNLLAGNVKQGSNENENGGSGGNAGNEPVEEKCAEDHFKCTDDHIIFCNPEDTTKTEKLPCNTFLGTNTGYCNCEKDQCQVNPPTNCPGVPATATCKVDGQFTPSPTNCKQFSYCDGVDLLYYECEDNLVFDPKNSVCNIGVCRTVRCPTTTSTVARPVYVPFPQDDSWYLLCYKGKSTVNKCADGLAAGPTGCSFKCPGVGNWPDPKQPDSNSYYSCTGTAPNYKKTLKTCANPQHVFDKTIRLCKKKKP